MKRLWTTEIPKNTPCIIVMGMMDGVHIGHQALLHAQQKICAQYDAKPIVLSFSHHPLSILRPEKAPKLLMNAEEKVIEINRLGSHAIIIDPDETFLNLEWDVFLKKIFKRTRVLGFVCGKNHRFGRDGEGDYEKLESFCQEHELIFRCLPQVSLEGHTVSSSQIRTLLLKGNASLAERMLSRPYSLTSTIQKGRGIAGQHGIPTANLCPSQEKIWPADGVYASFAWIDNVRHPAVVDVGIGPTLQDGRHRRLEVHILSDVTPDYGMSITVEFITRLRGEVVFASTQELFDQIRKDIGQAEEICANAIQKTLYTTR